MFLTPYESLKWAYQLHYDLRFRTHRRRPIFADQETSLNEVLNEICARHDYHLLDVEPRSDYLRSLISLQPSQAIAKVIQTIKANSARESGIPPPVWARGYLARSVGRMRIEAVRQYLEQQPHHHGYDTRVLPPVYRYRATEPIELRAGHAVFDLSHHLVFATSSRKGIFGAGVGQATTEYWLRVASKSGFAIDQVSFVPDHVHLIVRIVPKMSIEECALSLMNNSQYFMGKHYPELLIEAGVEQLWEASAYAGTCGELTTALIKNWLSGE